MLNQIILSGNVVRSLEMKYTKNNKEMVTFSLAVGYKDNTDFIECVAFGKIAKYIFENLKDKGRLQVVGTLKNNNYEKQGVKIYTYQVFVNTASVIDFKDKNKSEIDEFNNNVINPFIDSQEIPRAEDIIFNNR